MLDIEGTNYLGNAFGQVGTQDQAKYLASQYIAGLATIVNMGIDPRFELTRYGERLAASNPVFDDLHESLHGQETLVDDYLEEIVNSYMESIAPDLVGITVPFPGNMYGALRIAKTVKEQNSDCKVAIGGGFVNTELRELKDPRVFEFIDFVTLDDGERPFLSLLEALQEKRPSHRLFRTLSAMAKM